MLNAENIENIEKIEVDQIKSEMLKNFYNESKKVSNKKMKSYFSHSVNNFYGSDLIINNKSVQVRSQLMSKKTNNLIIRQGYKKTDYYFLVGDDTPTYTFFGYIAPKDIEILGEWTNFGHNSRPYVWSIPIDKLKPISHFKYER